MLYPSAQDILIRRCFTEKAKKRLFDMERIAANTIMRAVREETMDHTDLGWFTNFMIQNMGPQLPLLPLAGLVLRVRAVSVHQQVRLDKGRSKATT